MRVRRREFIGLIGGTAAWPFMAGAQVSERIVTVGYLGVGTARQWTEGHGRDFREALRDLGYIEGKNLRFEPRFAEGDDSRLPALARELVGLDVDVIVTYSSGVYAAQESTSTIPIVMATAGDLITPGLVSSLAHPGGNITGSTFFAPELLAKRLQMLKEIAPSLERACLLLLRSTLPAERSRQHTVEVVQAAAEAVNVELFPIEASGPREFESAFATCAEERIGGLVASDVAQFTTLAAFGEIAALAVARRLPTLGSPGLAINGGLFGYGVEWKAMYRRAAYFVDKIIKGEKPGDIPIEQATKFETVVNLTTAKAIGVDIPPLLLAGADEVIE
jgi:putative ABC transport system substrate-binding protein